VAQAEHEPESEHGRERQQAAFQPRFEQRHSGALRELKTMRSTPAWTASAASPGLTVPAETLVRDGAPIGEA
jgi:hypothetical protein